MLASFSIILTHVLYQVFVVYTLGIPSKYPRVVLINLSVVGVVEVANCLVTLDSCTCQPSDPLALSKLNLEGLVFMGGKGV